MYRTKVTRKGQVTIPEGIRSRLRIQEGDVLTVRRVGNRVVLEEREDIMKAFGAWGWFTEKDREAVRTAWRGWDEALSRQRRAH